MKTEYWIHVKNVDNRLVIYLNGETIWDSGIVHDDPSLNEFIEITNQLKAHPEHASELIFEGFNDSYVATDNKDHLNPWHFSYRVFKKVINDSGKVVSESEILNPYDEKHLSNPNIRAINNAYQLIFKEDEFRVVSNSLQQHFYR